LYEDIEAGFDGGEILGGAADERGVGAMNMVNDVAFHEYGTALEKVSKALNISKQNTFWGVEAEAAGPGKRWLRIKDP